jgi:hypothetical protein
MCSKSPTDSTTQKGSNNFELNLFETCNKKRTCVYFYVYYFVIQCYNGIIWLFVRGMAMVRYISSQKVEIDIHNMYRADAKKFLEHFLSTVNGSVKEVIVIHGYSSGTVLQSMVRNELKHRRIKTRMISMNPGITTLFLK